MQQQLSSMFLLIGIFSLLLISFQLAISTRSPRHLRQDYSSLFNIGGGRLLGDGLNETYIQEMNGIHHVMNGSVQIIKKENIDRSVIGGNVDSLINGEEEYTNNATDFSACRYWPIPDNVNEIMKERYLPFDERVKKIPRKTNPSKLFTTLNTFGNLNEPMQLLEPGSTEPMRSQVTRFWNKDRIDEQKIDNYKTMLLKRFRHFQSYLEKRKLLSHWTYSEAGTTTILNGTIPAGLESGGETIFRVSKKVSLVIPCQSGRLHPLWLPLTSMLYQQVLPREVSFVISGVGLEDRINPVIGFLEFLKVSNFLDIMKNHNVKVNVLGVNRKLFAAEARGLGGRKSTSDVVFFIDSDDYMLPWFTRLIDVTYTKHAELDYMLVGAKYSGNQDRQWKYNEWHYHTYARLFQWSTMKSGWTFDFENSDHLSKFGWSQYERLRTMLPVDRDPWFLGSIQNEPLWKYACNDNQEESKDLKYFCNLEITGNITDPGNEELYSIHRDWEWHEGVSHNGWPSMRKLLLEHIPVPTLLRTGEDSAVNYRVIKSGLNAITLSPEVGVYLTYANKNWEPWRDEEEPAVQEAEDFQAALEILREEAHSESHGLYTDWVYDMVFSGMADSGVKEHCAYKTAGA